MGSDFLNFVSEQGLPWWIVLLIGGGTIVAALISFLGAFAIAWVNARAAVRLDLERSLRDHRRNNVIAVRDYILKSAVLIGRGRMELSAADDDLQTFLEQAVAFMTTLQASGKELGALHTDGDEVKRVTHLYFKSGRLLGLALANVAPTDQTPYSRIDPYFDLVMSVVVEVDTIADADYLLSPRVGVHDWTNIAELLLALVLGGDLAVEDCPRLVLKLLRHRVDDGLVAVTLLALLAAATRTGKIAQSPQSHTVSCYTNSG